MKFFLCFLKTLKYYLLIQFLTDIIILVLINYLDISLSYLALFE